MQYAPGMQCYICGVELEPPQYCRPQSLTADHVIPKSAGGKVTKPCCRRCNTLKGAWHPCPELYLLVRFASLYLRGHTCVRIARYKEFLALEYKSGFMTVEDDTVVVYGGWPLDKPAAELYIKECLRWADSKFRSKWDHAMPAEKQIELLNAQFAGHGYRVKNVVRCSTENVYTFKFSNKSRFTVVLQTGHPIQLSADKLRTGLHSPTSKELHIILEEVNAIMMDFNDVFDSAVALSEHSNQGAVDIAPEPAQSNAHCLFCGAEVNAPESNEFSVVCQNCTVLYTLDVPVTDRSLELIKELLSLREG